MKSSANLVVLVIAVLFALHTGAVAGTVLRLSQYSSDRDDNEYPTYLAEYLDAELDFSVAGSTLALGVTNLTPENAGDPAFKINKIYFNVTDNVQGLTLTTATGPEDSVTNEWELGFSEDGFLVGGFGRFDVSLTGGHGNQPNVINPGETVSFVFQITGSAPFSDSDFITLSSQVGGHIVSYAAAKFYNDDDVSAYGATNIPEPATVFILGLGSLTLLRKRRIKVSKVS